MKKRGHLRGFTIIELLIVVVVIAILATITVVAYNGIQQSAYNSKAVANTDTYKKALMLYAAENGSYPTYPTASTCLGGGYPDKNGDGVGDCIVGADGVVQASQIPSADDPLNSTIGGQPNMGDGQYRQRPIPATDNQFFVTSSVRYIHQTNLHYNGTYNPDWLVHIILGKGIDCRRPVAASVAGGIVNFIDASESTGKDIALKECYEPLPPPGS